MEKKEKTFLRGGVSGKLLERCSDDGAEHRAHADALFSEGRTGQRQAERIKRGFSQPRTSRVELSQV